MALYNLSRRKMRTTLTLLGILVGIGAVVAMISLGSGMESAITEALESFGPNKIYVMAKGAGGMGGFGGAAFGESLTDKDVDRIKNVRGVKTVIPMSITTLPVEYKGEKQNLWVAGIPAEGIKEFFTDIESLELSKGRIISEGEKYTTIAGYLIENDIYAREVTLRSKLTVKDTDFRVVGFVKRIGSPQDDAQIYITIEAFRELTGKYDEVNAIVAEAYENPNEVAKNIEKELERVHGKDMFMAMTTEQVQEQMESIFGVMSIVLGGIAGISLLVAGFGIMNTMLMSVLERTREIGVMKALGATNTKIMTVFLVETATIGLIGGVLGIVFGSVIYIGISYAAINYLGVALPMTIQPSLIITALVFSIAVGIASGLYPAWRASKLNPVEALRYE